MEKIFLRDILLKGNIRKMIIIRNLIRGAVGLCSLIMIQAIFAEGQLSVKSATSTPITVPSEQPIDDLDTVHLGFQRIMNENELEAFIRTNNVKPTAFFYHIKGRGGTVREYKSVEGLSHREVVKTALDKVLRHRKKAEAGEVLLARRFLKKYPLGRVKNSKDSSELQDRLRYLLDIREQRLADVKDIENGIPIIYGLEVRVKADKREQLYNNINVRHLLSRNIMRSYSDAKLQEKEMSILNRSKFNGSILPDQYKANQRSPNSESLLLSTEEMYRKLIEISKTTLPMEKGNE